jgi:hypothetical protein
MDRLYSNCEKCGKGRSGATVFRECPCILKPVFAPMKESSIRNELTTFFKLYEDLTIETKSLYALDPLLRIRALAKTINCIQCMSSEALRLLAFGQKGSYSYLHIAIATERGRIDIPLATNKNDAAALRATMIDTPLSFMLLIHFNACVFVNDGAQCPKEGSGLCVTHQLWFYLAHTELLLSAGLDELTTRICLEYILREYYVMSACVPGRRATAKRGREHSSHIDASCFCKRALEASGC